MLEYLANNYIRVAVILNYLVSIGIVIVSIDEINSWLCWLSVSMSVFSIIFGKYFGIKESI
jgi:hypothetical protein